MTNRRPKPDSCFTLRGKAERAPSHPCSGAFRRSPFFRLMSQTLTIPKNPGKEYGHTPSLEG